MNYSFFVNRVTERLLESGWNKLEGFNESVDLAVVRDDITGAVTTKRMIAFLNGDRLSKDGIKQVLDSVHTARKKAANPPLCPVTNVLVFVFSKIQDVDWILEKAKKRDIFSTNYTVSWVVELTKSSLKKHKGLPMINSGTSEIEATLNCTS